MEEKEEIQFKTSVAVDTPKKIDEPLFPTQVPDSNPNPGNVKGIIIFFILVAILFVGIAVLPPILLKADQDKEEVTTTSTLETNFEPITRQSNTTTRKHTSSTSSTEHKSLSDYAISTTTVDPNPEDGSTTTTTSTTTSTTSSAVVSDGTTSTTTTSGPVD